MNDILIQQIKQKIIDACPKDRYVFDNKPKGGFYIYYKEEGDNFIPPKRYRWRMHNRACRMIPTRTEIRDGDIYRIRRAPIRHLVTIEFTVKEKAEAN